MCKRNGSKYMCIMKRIVQTGIELNAPVPKYINHNVTFTSQYKTNKLPLQHLTNLIDF